MVKFGRKWTMLSLVIPFIIGWSLVIWAQSFWMMLIGRVCIGIAGGAFCKRNHFAYTLYHVFKF
jgi:predicted MFS family arabinose efflux permease